MEFRWNDWNIEHVQEHGVQPEEAEEVADRASRPFPDYMGNGKWLVWGATGSGRMLQIVYIVDEDGTCYIIHARPLDDREKHRFRRRAL